MLATRRSLGVLAVVAVVLAVAVPAHADGTNPVECSKFPNSSECTISVGTPGGPGRPGNDGGDPGNDGNTNSACHYERSDVQLPAPPGKTNGGWYVLVCLLGDGGVSQSQAMWLDAGQAADPRALAQEALSRLRLPSPAIRVNPAPPLAQLVHLPTWLWLDAASWRTRSATASVPGLSVIATARPTTLTFAAGDGRSFVCPGPGTPWTNGRDPNAASPTCGHTYARPGPFTLSATVTWSVSWVGGGQSGTVPDLTSTAAAAITVTESQTLNRDPRG